MTTDTTPAEAQETEATVEYVTADLNGDEIRVLIATKWRPSYMRALRGGDFDAWAAGVIHPDDVEVFVEKDPTFEEIANFANRAMSASGEAPGKSGRPSARSRSTRKR